MNTIFPARIFIICLFIFISGIALGAQPVISGRVTDDKNESLTGAVVELRNSKDSTLVKANVIDANGQFAFENIAEGKYFLKITFLGFEPHRSNEISFDGLSSKEIPAIKLSASSVNLKEATVSGIKPLIEVKSDKTIFNVENSINSTGNSAYELLQKAPGVVVDNNDNISLKGRSGVLVQIDGRDTHLSEQELADYLRSLQSNDIESIELISNPSSKYEARGTAGIINIKLKKNKNFGTNGSVSAGYSFGDFSKYNLGLSLNNRGKKLNLFSNYTGNWGERENDFYLYREQNPYIFDASSIFKRWGLNNNYKAGADYTLNKKNTIGAMVIGNYSDVNGTTTSRNEIHDFESNEIDSVLISNQTIDGHTNNINLNLNHHYSDTTGHDLMTDFDFGFYDNIRDNYQPNIYVLPDNSTELSSTYNRIVSSTDIKIFTAKTDYTQNFLKGKLGVGYKLSFVKTDNLFKFYNILGDVETIDNTRSNHFVYQENVYAGYLNYQRTLGKFDFQAGLRMEHTQSEGDLKSAADTVKDKNVPRNYTDFFPSGGLTWNANQNNAFALIYTSRIDRPNYQELNPFEFKLDELSYRKGNPFLNPQYSDKIELSHTYKYATTTSVGYSNTRDFFAQITDTLSGGRSYLTSRNLATEKIFSFNVGSSLQPLKWYGIYFNFGVYNSKYDADFGNGKTIKTSVTNINIYAQNTIKLPMAITLEISGWYNSAGVWGGAYVTEPQGSLDLGLQKKLFKDQATLKLSYSDLLNTAPWDSHNVYAGIVIRAHGNWESQMFRATFTWRFGNNQMKGIKQRTTGSDSENKRIGAGDQ